MFVFVFAGGGLPLGSSGGPGKHVAHPTHGLSDKQLLENSESDRKLRDDEKSLGVFSGFPEKFYCFSYRVVFLGKLNQNYRNSEGSWSPRMVMSQKEKPY